MNDLRQRVIESQGGLDRFRQFSVLTAQLHQFGILSDLKGKPDVGSPSMPRRRLGQSAFRWAGQRGSPMIARARICFQTPYL
jgi:hypothetical protein